MEKHEEINYDRPVEIADNVFWIGFFDELTGLHCNPYLIIDGDEAVVIDGGSRPDFATVMMKILQTGISPNQIRALIYQHYDPDLCGSLPNFEDIIKNKDLQIVSARENFMFISHYALHSQLYPIRDYDFKYAFSSGRSLEFIQTPYSHSLGSFTTFDPETNVLFTSDLFGSFGTQWELYLPLAPHCMECVDIQNCPLNNKACPILDIEHFHQQIMPSEKALRYALNQLAGVPFDIIAPQHGSVLRDKKIINYIFKRLAGLDGIGIDGIISDHDNFRFSKLERFLDQ
jgi:flavorubredoxin